MAGFQPVSTDIAIEQRIAVALFDIVIGKFQLGIDRIKLREIINQVTRQGREIAGG